MVNRCDSVDALRYAYYEMMRIKEENQMLEKNKDYVEFTLEYTSVDWARSKDCPEVCLKGYSDFSFPGVPIMDVVCNEFDHKVVVVSKSDFDQLQASNKCLTKRVEYLRNLAKQREENYKALLDKTGFYNVADLMSQLPKDKTLKDIIDGRDAENKELKKKFNEFDPLPEFRELLKKLYSTDDTVELEWVLNHTCGGRGSVNGWRAVSSFWSENYKTLSKLVGFSSVEEIQDYLTNEGECDTLHEAILKLKDQVKYTCDEWYSANSSNNSWKAASECNSPKELIEKREALEKEIGIYSRTLNEWKEGTGCPSPSAAKSVIESAMSWHDAYTEAKGKNRKLIAEVESWKNATGYSTPEDYLHARISDATPFDYTASWQAVTGCSCPKDLSKKIVEWEKILTPHRSARDLCSAMSNAIEAYKSSVVKWLDATGCDTPEAAKKRINGIISEAEALESDYNHLLTLTGFDNEGEIEDFLEQNNDRNKLTTVFDNLKLENEAMKAALRASNIAMQEELDQEIDKWQKATGRTDPEAAKQYIDRLKGRLNKIHGYSVDW